MKNPMGQRTLEKECRNYYLNQAMVRAYEKADAGRKHHPDTPAGRRARKQFESMNVQIAHVDQIRSCIRKNYGTEAERMFTWYYIDGMKTENIAARFSIPYETFQERMNEWIEKESEVTV